MTENETIERCDLLINSLSVDNGVTNAFCDRSKGYVTFEKMREFTLNCKKALEEVQQYRKIGSVDECIKNKDFLDFLSDKMNPNDFEIYLSMYNSSSEKQEGERWED